MTRLGVAALLLLGGCAATQPRVADAFPLGSVAAPWVLQGEEVWSGSFDDAAAALGNDAETWRELGPTRVWLAVYAHETEPQRCLKVRCLAFAAADDARRAYGQFRPPDAKPLRYGDAGCWTGIGVLFHWGRLVFDVFGPAASWSSELQATYLASIIEKRMPRGAPDQPQ